MDIFEQIKYEQAKCCNNCKNMNLKGFVVGFVGCKINNIGVEKYKVCKLFLKK